MSGLGWGDADDGAPTTSTYRANGPDHRDEVFPQTDAPTAAGPAPVFPPTRLLVGAAVAVGSSTLLLVFDNSAVRVLGYLLGTMVTIGLVSAFFRIDLHRRRLSTYVRKDSLSTLGGILVAAGFLVAVVHVWRLARALT